MKSTKRAASGPASVVSAIGYVIGRCESAGNSPTSRTRLSMRASVAYTMPSGASPRATYMSATRTSSARDQAVHNIVPYAEAGQCCCARTGLPVRRPGSPVARRPFPSALASGNPGAIVSSTLLSAGAISASRLPSTLSARRLLDAAPLLQVVHPLLVRREEHVGAGAGLDLARERGTRGEVRIGRACPWTS